MPIENTIDEHTTELSEDVRDIVDRMPSNFSLFTVLLLTFITITLIALGFLIKYPDIVTGQILVNSRQSSIKLVNKIPGKLNIENLSRGSYVKEGRIVATIQNAASTKDVEKLKEILQKYNPISDTTFFIIKHKLSDSLSLGELSPAFYEFTNVLSEIITEKKYSSFDQQLKSTGDLIVEQKKLLKQGLKILDTRELQLEISNSSYQRNITLYNQKVIAKAEVEKSNADYLTSLENNERIRNELINNKVSLSTSINKILELSNGKKTREEQLRSKLISVYNVLMAQLIDWENKYCLFSPISGRLEFQQFWAQNQFIPINTELFNILPDANFDKIEVYIPSDGVGKVKVGQEAIIKLEDFPYMEFGWLEGKVASIFLSKTIREKENLTLVIIQIKKGNNQNMGLKYGMRGSAEIITEDKRLIERLFSGIKYILRR